MNGLRSRLETAFEIVVMVLMAAIAIVVIVGVGFRKFGDPLVWYDEVASILLSWLTYYGASLAALKGTHIGFPKLVDSSPPAIRRVLLVVREVVVVGFFALIAWAGWQVLMVLDGMSLVSLPWVPASLAQSVIPIGAVLFIAAELVAFIERWSKLDDGAEGTGK